MEDSQPSIPPPSAPARRPVWGWTLLAVFLVCLLVGGVAFLGYSVIRGGMRQVADAKASGNQFLDALQSADTVGAYTQTSSGFKSAATQADTEDLLHNWLQKIGKIQYYTVAGFNAGANPAGRFTNLSYSVHGSRRDGNIMVNLVQEDGVWKVQGFNVNLGPPNRDAHPAP